MAARNYSILQLLTILLIVLLPCNVPLVFGQIQITALTPQEAHGMPDGTTIVLQLATALLASTGMPGLLWGTIAADAVSSICNQVTQDGQYSFSASVTYDGNTFTRNMQISTLAGCGASYVDPTDGVEAVLVDDKGTISALICPREASSTNGCNLFDTGDDLTSLYNQAAQNTQLDTTSIGGRRKLLDEIDCDGLQTRLVFGVLASIYFCSAGLNLACDIGLGLVGVGIAVTLRLGIFSSCNGGRADSGCFPGNAMVTISSGVSMPISRLSIGDKIAVHSHNGDVDFSSVYAFGHADPSILSPFVQITSQPAIYLDKLSQDVEQVFQQSSITRVVRLTGDHFIPIIIDEVRSKVAYKRAREVLVGDLIFGHHYTDHRHVSTINATSVFTPFVVQEVIQIMEQGLYNPFTLEGDIIVDNVVASQHSEWFLDSLFDTLGISYLLPYVYQHILAPIRFLYYVLGDNIYSWLYSILNCSIGSLMIGDVYVSVLATLTLLLVGYASHTISYQLISKMK